MKKVDFKGKLNLSKETVSKLNDGQLHLIIGRGPSQITLCNACPSWAVCGQASKAACATNLTYCC
jgi:hypothetical protein